MTKARRIASKVWRRGWRREAAATQAASQELAAVIAWCESEGFSSAAKNIRQAALETGAVRAVAELHTAFSRRVSG